jgi:serine/threonine-protein kinase HipA
MTLLRKNDGGAGSYLEVAEFIQKNGVRDHIQRDLAELFRRVVFNIMVGNRDDHLRNHGFILTAEGWRLSPAYDMNPSIDKTDHTLAIDDVDNRADLTTAIATSAFYGLDRSAAASMVEKIVQVVARWPGRARKVGIASADISLMGSAFSANKLG